MLFEQYTNVVKENAEIRNQRFRKHFLRRFALNINIFFLNLKAIFVFFKGIITIVIIFLKFLIAF